MPKADETVQTPCFKCGAFGTLKDLDPNLAALCRSCALGAYVEAMNLKGRAPTEQKAPHSGGAQTMKDYHAEGGPSASLPASVFVSFRIDPESLSVFERVASNNSLTRTEAIKEALSLWYASKTGGTEALFAAPGERWGYGFGSGPVFGWASTKAAAIKAAKERKTISSRESLGEVWVARFRKKGRVWERVEGDMWEAY